ncbi:CHAT domain-containing protein [Actinokineospora diospyrosa]|uniref:CHAT domain-containing protein n=1 Tax=Actinokineospora diospyrosa TaxID=103728 RepID=A0ABT1I9Q4_9PSEU|nr:CHAT domain-containing protein [Actinokineospora diospyrosa]MCP2269367.1 CHAT domain-containing protein [Actinokineospora diospyrosa]
MASTGDERIGYTDDELVEHLLAELDTVVAAPTWARLHSYLETSTWLVTPQVRGAVRRLTARAERTQPAAARGLAHAGARLDRATTVVVPAAPDARTAVVLRLIDDRGRVELTRFLLVHTELHQGPGLAATLAVIDGMLPINNDTVGGRLRDIRALLLRCAEVGPAAAAAEVDFEVAFPHLGFPPDAVEFIDLVWPRALAGGGDRLDALLRLHALVEPDMVSVLDPDSLADVRIGIGIAHRRRYQRAEHRADIDRAIGCFEQAAAGYTDDLSRARAMLNLATCLDDRYSDWGEPADLDRKAATCRELVELSEPASPEWLAATGGLGTSLKDRFRLTGDPDDLAESRDRLTAAVEVAAERYPDELPRVQHNLGLALLESYLFTGVLAFLRGSADLHRRSVAVTAGSHPSWPVRVMSLGNTLRQLHDTADDEAALQESVTVLRELVESGAGGPSIQYRASNNLALSLAQRHSLHRDAADIDEAIRLLEDLLAVEPKSSPVRAGHVVSLATCLLQRHRESGDPDDLDRSVTLYDETGGDTVAPGWFGIVRDQNRAAALAARYDRSGSAADRDRAITLYRDLCATAAAAGATEAGWRCAEAWARWARKRGAWAESAEAHGYALPLMDQWYRDQHTAEGRRNVAEQIRNYAWYMAYACGKAGDGGAAVTVLEQARCLWLTDVMDWDAADLALLAEVDPESHRAWLACQERSAQLQATLAGSPEVGPAAATAMHALRGELAALRDEVRRLPGLAGFLERPGGDEVFAKASPRPIVYLITVDVGGFAFIVTADRVQVIELSALTESAFHERLQPYMNAESNRDANVREYVEELDRVTGWLWDEVVSELVAHLSGVDSLTLIPVGILTFAPWHAAWTAVDGERRYWSDTCLITYAPTARVLAEEPDESAPRTVLAVGDPVGAGLPWSERELRVAAATAGSRLLLGAEATPDEVFRLLPEHDVLHLSCHGSLQADPMNSSLVLAGGSRLAVRDLTRRRLAHLRLAVLSACDSAFPGMDLAQEAVGFPAMLLSAGATGVIGALWPVSDLSTAVLVERFYEHWRAGEPPAEALRLAQRWMRGTERYSQPFHWAGFVYFGR